MSALASLNADYSDSEDELEDGHRKKGREEEEEEEKEEQSGRAEEGEQPESPLNPILDRLREGVPSRGGSTSRHGSVSDSAKSTPTKMTRLVSYAEEGNDDDDSDAEKDAGDNDGVGDDPGGGEAEKDKEEDPSGVVPMDLESESSQDGAEKEQQEDLDTSRGVKVDTWTDGITLPPEPPGFCNPKVQEFFAEQWKKKQETANYDINKSVNTNKKFRNPGIYDKLINLCDIDEHGTNFPKELYDGHLFGKESYYDELDRVQAAEMKRREKATAEKRKNEDASAAAAAAKRRSKWDQGAAAVGAANAAKTISAFGPLKK